MSTKSTPAKSTLLLAPAMAPFSKSDSSYDSTSYDSASYDSASGNSASSDGSLACAVRDLARALQDGGWSVTVALGIDASDEDSLRLLGQGGLARRLAPLRLADQSEVVVYEGEVGKSAVLVLATQGPPTPARILEAALAIAERPDLLQLWSCTASALSAAVGLKSLVHWDESREGDLSRANIVLLSSTVAAKAVTTSAAKAAQVAAKSVGKAGTKTVNKAGAQKAASPLEGIAAKIRGLAPGFDAREWNPSRDSMLTARMEPPSAALKSEEKAALRKELGLQDVDQPLIGVISRIDKLPRSLGAELLKLPMQIAGIEAGPHIEALASRSPQRAASRRGLSDRETRQLRHRIVAAADFILMPHSTCLGGEASSVLFPCRYGTSVIAPNQGECAERIVNFDLDSLTGSGFLYRDSDDLLAAIRRAVAAWQSSEETRSALVDRCLALDLSWQTTALRFNEIVRPLL